MKNLSKLIKKTVVGKDGKKHTVWVKPNQGATDTKQSADKQRNEAAIEGAKGMFIRAKRAWNVANGNKDDAAKKKASAALDKYHKQLVNMGVQKPTNKPFWNQ